MKTFIFLFGILIFSHSYAGLLIKPEQVLKEEFVDAVISKKNILLNKSQVKKIQNLSKSKLHSSIITTYLVQKDGKVLAYGIIHIHKVRTKKETVLFILSPDCKIQDIEIIAFYEPPEYMPNKKWLETFKGKSSKDELRLKRDVPNITGATLSSKAITLSSKQVISICEVVFKGKK
jgi:Na+-translocating ferredoxin:NAD+ oxidoreductase RnfG subunit